MPHEETQLTVGDFTWGALTNNTPLTLWMDTWYANPDATIGVMPIERTFTQSAGATDVNSEANGPFLLNEALRFTRAFAHMIDVVHFMFVYRPDTNPIAVHSDVIRPQSSADWLRESEQVARKRKTFLSLDIMFDPLVSVHSSAGEIITGWLPWTGHVWFHTVPLGPKDIARRFHPDPPSLRGAHGVISSEAWDWGVASMRYAAVAQQWQAELRMEVASLFNEDNSDILTHTRDAWRLDQELRRTRAQRKRAKRRQALQGDATVTEQDDDDELSNEVGSAAELAEIRQYKGLITLAAPSPETPATNAELYALNAPRLAEGIAAWERETGSPFSYMPPLRDPRA